MASLRARLLAAVLVLAAVGLVLVGAVTYAEQRSFLLDRVDQQAREAPMAAARALADAGYGPPVPDRDRAHDRHGQGGPPPGSAGPRFVPEGTYVERRDASGRPLGHATIAYGQRLNARPALPERLTVGRLLTVHGRDGDDTRYRVLAEPDPSGSGTTVIAVPLSEVDANLRRLLIVEALVIG